MGLVYTEVELTNGDDLSLARKKIIGEEEIKSIRVKMPVDTGSAMLAINENIQELLQLPVVDTRKAHGKRPYYRMQDRCPCRAAF